MAELASSVFHALGDSTRLMLIERLERSGPTTTLRLVDGLGMSRQAATKHLVILENAGLILSQSKGREVLRLLNPTGMKAANDWLESRRKFWDSKLSALKDLVETPETPPDANNLP